MLTRKLSFAQASEIRDKRAQGATLQALANEYGVAITVITKIVNNMTYKQPLADDTPYANKFYPPRKDGVVKLYPNGVALGYQQGYFYIIDPTLPPFECIQWIHGVPGVVKIFPNGAGLVWSGLELSEVYPLDLSYLELVTLNDQIKNRFIHLGEKASKFYEVRSDDQAD